MLPTPSPQPTGIQKYDCLANTISDGDLLKLDLPKPSWHVSTYLPRSSLVFFAGAPGSYKTFFAIKVARALASGTPLFDSTATLQQNNPDAPVDNSPLPTTNVLFIEEEMNATLVQDRARMFSRASHTPITNLYYALSSGIKLTDEGHMEELKAFVTEHDVKLVIMDPFSSVAGFTDENDNAEAAKTLDALRKALVDSSLGVTVLLIHHPSKAGGQGGHNRSSASPSSLRGAGDILGKCDHAVVFERSEVMPQTTLTVIKSRLVDITSLPIQTVLFNKVHELATTDWDEMKLSMELVASTSRAEMHKSDEKTKKGVTTAQILEIVRAGGSQGVTQKDVLETLGITRSGTFLRVWQELVDTEGILRDPLKKTFVVVDSGGSSQTKIA